MITKNTNRLSKGKPNIKKTTEKKDKAFAQADSKKKILEIYNNITITSAQMYQIEDNGSRMGFHKSYMMENAGHGLADFIISKFGEDLFDKKIVFICGTGNNGGDAMVATRHLSCNYGLNLFIIIVGNSNKIKTEEAKMNWILIQKLKKLTILYCDGDSFNPKSSHIENDEFIKKIISDSDIIIDGIFGTGIKDEVKEPQKTIIGLINKSKAYVISVDVPSGIDPTTGTKKSVCVKADSTITFHRIKNGLLQSNTRKYCGEIYLEKIGIPCEAEEEVIL